MAFNVVLKIIIQAILMVAIFAFIFRQFIIFGIKVYILKKPPQEHMFTVNYDDIIWQLLIGLGLGTIAFGVVLWLLL